MASLFKLEKSGSTFLRIISDKNDVVDLPLKELQLYTSDGVKEKHIPIVEVVNNIVDVNVGQINHPMSEEHYIQYIVLETNLGIQYKTLLPYQNPHVQFALLTGEVVVATYAYCNLHGLWLA